MVGDWSYSSPTFKLRVLVLASSSILTIIAFFSPYWLQSSPSPRLPNPKFTNLGLWHACFNGFHDKGHKYEVKFYGCRHVLLEEYDIIRSELMKPFYVATQFFFTVCFVGLLISIGLVVMFLLCIDDYYKVKVLRWIGFHLIAAGVCGTIAIIVFGAEGDGRYFMPDWEHNYLSWAFGLASVGVLLMYVAAVLFLVDARVMLRREESLEKQEKNMHYPMERNV